MIHALESKITDSIDYKKTGILVGYVNVYNYAIFRKHPAIVKEFNHFTLDGIALVVLIRILFRRRVQRKSPDFSSYFTALFSFIESSGRRAGFVGGSPDEIALFQEQLKSIYPGMHAVLFQDGYTIDEERINNQLQMHEIEVLILGMGSPKQELLAIKLRKKGFRGSIYTCGAFISQTAAGGKVYYPQWINRLHLRWMYRIYKQPELYKRYLIAYPKAMSGVIGDYMKKNKTASEYSGNQG